MAAVFWLAKRRRERVFRERRSKIDEFSDDELRGRYRFGREGLRFICNLLEHNLKRETRRNNALTVEEQVLTALRFYASGSFQEVLGDTIGLHRSTVCRIIRQVSVALASKLDEFVKWPTCEEKKEIKHGFSTIAGMPGVVGCIDCTHVRVQAPTENEPAYVNRKNYHSLNIQAVCDHEGKLTNIVARWPGSVHDSHIFRTSQLFQHLETHHRGIQDGFLLGDSGYACKPFLLTPFNQVHETHQENFNKAHSRTRVTIERTFGQWKRRFHVLHSEIRMLPGRACTIVCACAVLHNIAKILGEPMEEDVEAEEGPHVPGPVELEDGRSVREHVAQRFFQ